MKLISALLALTVAAIALSASASLASAANRAVVGVIDFEGKPTLVINGDRHSQNIRVSKHQVIPDEGDWSDPEVPVWSIWSLYHAVKLSPESVPGRCWQSDDSTVNCRRTDPAVKLLIASLGAGNDRLQADTASGSLQVKADGGPGNDSLTGDGWRDPVHGKPYRKPAGRDKILGGTGRDTIQGGAGADILIGGPGADVFANNQDRARDRISGGSGSDTLRDPDVKRRGSQLRILDRVSGFETLYLGFTRHRLR